MDPRYTSSRSHDPPEKKKRAHHHSVTGPARWKVFGILLGFQQVSSDSRLREEAIPKGVWSIYIG